MKNGYQGYIDFQITDDCDEVLDNRIVQKIVFKIGDLRKVYDGTDEEVSYDENKKKYNIWLTEQETMNLNERIKVEAKILTNDTNEVLGTYISDLYVHPTLITEYLTEVSL